MRCWPALLLLGGLAAGEGEGPPPVVRFNAAKMNMSMTPGRPSTMEEPRIGYEAVRLECAQLTYLLAALAGAPRPVLSTATFSGGPDGRILFDSAASQLQQMAFKGVLRPRTLTVRRLEADPERPAEVRYRAEAGDLGDLSGILATPVGPRRHVAWAERAVLEFVGAVDGNAAMGLGELRLTALHFYGRTQPLRQATVLRLKADAPPGPAEVDALVAARVHEMRASGAVISLYFDDVGGMKSIEGVEDFEGDGLVPMRAPNRPVLQK